MQDYQHEFIEFLLDAGVLTFGDFTTKSGRPTPYFVNTGRCRTGEQMRRLGEFYAAAALARPGLRFDVLFGPAYKGIPLVITTSMALAARGHDVAFCFNRKEAKDHGEGGRLVGHPLADGDRVLIVEDVTTAGTSIRETVPLVRAAAQVELAGLVVAVDRQERGSGEGTALAEIGAEFDMPAFSIVTIRDVVEHLSESGDGPARVAAEDLERIRHHLERFGAR